MSESEGGAGAPAPGGGGGGGAGGDLQAVEERIREVQRRKRGTVRWHMSRHTAERAIAAITAHSDRITPGKGKSRRRKRHKRLL